MSNAQSKAGNEGLLSRLESFFMGRVYPAIVCLLVLVGHVFGIELWLSIPNVLLLALALYVSRSVRPFIVFACTFIFSVSVQNGPGTPSYSDYYFTGYRLPIVIILFVIIFGSMAFFAVKNKIFRGISLTRTPLLLPLLVLSAAFLLNGAFSASWDVADLLMGVGEALIYTVLFLFFYFGIRGERREELIDYFIYVSALIAIMLILQCGALLVTSDGIIKDGSIVKEEVLLGWGIWNTVGVCLAVLIPVLFLGYMQKKNGWLYILLALATLATAALTQSRNAILFGGIVFVICLVISLAVGKRRLESVVLLGGLLVLAGLGDAILGGRLSGLLADVLSRGFADNGRFELWREGTSAFLSAPIFGSGFFTTVSDSAEFFPWMAHQTFVQLLASMGIFGLLAYLYYRVMTVVPLIRRPRLDTVMLALSVGVLLAESLLDNFIFYFIPVIYYSIALAIIHRDSWEDTSAPVLH